MFRKLTLLIGVQANQPGNVSMGELAQTLICHMVVWEGERCPPPSHPHCLWQVTELALRS